MVSIKQATNSAREFAANLLEPSQYNNLRLEEVESSAVDGNPVWLITLSMPDPDPAAMVMGGRRAYKIFTVQKEDGEVLSMKIRELAGA